MSQPVAGNVGDERGRRIQDARAIHFPDRNIAAAVAPDDVALAIGGGEHVRDAGIMVLRCPDLQLDVESVCITQGQSLDARNAEHRKISARPRQCCVSP
jgi:hypothetical protein